MQPAAFDQAPAQGITQLLVAWNHGETGALDRLVPLVEAELRRLAHHYMAGERAGHPFQTTALVNEAYLQLVDCSRVRWQDRAHFFAVCARLMRRILVDVARASHKRKRGGNVVHLAFDETLVMAPERSAELVALDDALQALSALDARKAQVVELRFFGGLSVDESAEVLNVSAATVMRDWSFARAWLLRELQESP